MSHNFACLIALAVLITGFFFGGKDNTGDGAPEGLPLICRFFLFPRPILSHWERVKVRVRLAPSCDGEPLSSSSFDCPLWGAQDHALSSLNYFVSGTPFFYGQVNKNYTVRTLWHNRSIIRREDMNYGYSQLVSEQRLNKHHSPNRIVLARVGGRGWAKA